jgi:Single-strand binding protein family
MIDALIAGRLYGNVTEREAKNGSPFAVCKIRVATAGGDGCIFVSVITFSPIAITALLALTDGDSVALCGELTPKVWTDKNGEARPALDLVAHAVLTSYHVSRKRQAIRDESEAAA